MNIQPLGDRVVVRRERADEKTAGGILLPDTAKNKPQKGTVVAVGPGKMDKNGKLMPVDVKAGDVVLFTSWAGDEFRDAKRDEVLLMRAEDILAVVEA
jgi:chaperonin GroES